MDVFDWTAALVSAYALGSFPTAYVVGRLAGGIDIRVHGSGNVGSTNTARVLGWRWGILVQLVDILKGVVAAALIPPLFSAGQDRASALGMLAGVAAVIGHCWPVWMGFRGGKGVNTAAGMLLVIAPIELLIGLGGFLLALLSSGYVSLGSLVAACLVPVAVALRLGWQMAMSSILFWGTLGIALIVFIRHRGNLHRLLAGTEYRFATLWLLGRLKRTHPESP